MGNKDQIQRAHAELEPAVAQLGPLSVPQLAATVMGQLSKIAAGRSSGGVPGAISPVEVELEYSTGCQLIGLPHGVGHLNYLPTRRGLAAFSRGSIEAAVQANEPGELVDD